MPIRFSDLDTTAGDFEEGGVGVDVVAVVGECCVADAERVVVPEVGGAVSDLV